MLYLYKEKKIKTQSVENTKFWQITKTFVTLCIFI